MVGRGRRRGLDRRLRACNKGPARFRAANLRCWGGLLRSTIRAGTGRWCGPRQAGPRVQPAVLGARLALPPLRGLCVGDPEPRPPAASHGIEGRVIEKFERLASPPGSVSLPPRSAESNPAVTQKPKASSPWLPAARTGSRPALHPQFRGFRADGDIGAAPGPLLVIGPRLPDRRHPEPDGSGNSGSAPAERRDPVRPNGGQGRQAFRSATAVRPKPRSRHPVPSERCSFKSRLCCVGSAFTHTAALPGILMGSRTVSFRDASAPAAMRGLGVPRAPAVAILSLVRSGLSCGCSAILAAHILCVARQHCPRRARGQRPSAAKKLAGRIESGRHDRWLARISKRRLGRSPSLALWAGRSPPGICCTRRRPEVVPIAAVPDRPAMPWAVGTG